MDSHRDHTRVVESEARSASPRERSGADAECQTSFVSPTIVAQESEKANSTLVRTAIARLGWMATHLSRPAVVRAEPPVQPFPAVVPVGRSLFALLFLVSAFEAHFSASTIARAASQGAPFALVVVPFSGLIAIVGAALVALGWHTRLGALLLVLFLVPVTMMMHRFWFITDPMTRTLQHVMFFKNLALIGGALLLAHFGGGPYSVDAGRA